jgi:serine/threonine-protein kinase
LDEETLADLADGQRRLQPEWEAHLADCVDCRQVFAAVARGRRAQAQSIEEVGEPTFEELGQGVVVGGRYELERFLGAGGMAVVWAARRTDAVGNPEVAIKVARTADPTVARRFEREARVAAALHHPNVVRTIDVLAGVAGRGPCLVQELLVGESLDSRLRRGPMTLPEAARVLVPVAHAVAAAHARGILHRDLKPQNVFLGTDRVVVLDFGIAKLLPAWGAHSRITRSGVVVGTPGYMPPEQLYGEMKVDPRTDVWALGALLYCVLAGAPPIPARTFGEALSQLRRGPWLDLAQRVPDLPADVHDLARRALAADIELRLRDVQVFADTLGRYW